MGQERPVYFLHIHKCAGTTTRLLMENAFSANAIFEPYAGGYYPADLPNNPNIHVAYKHYRGHFGWALPQAIHDRELTVVTLLREPIDRMLSFYHYVRQYGRLTDGLTFMEWMEHFLELRQTLTSHLVFPDESGGPMGGEEARASSLSVLPEARRHLSTCRVVGMSERLDDSINLLAWHLGFLPPVVIPRNNPTLARARRDEIPEAARARVAYLLEADLLLYQEGQRMFEAAMDDMLAALAPDLGQSPETMAVRSWLRERYVDRLGEVGAQHPDPSRIEWLPDDVFLGEGLHDREQHDGLGLRWTGPGNTVRFVVYLGRPRAWRIRFRLHAATPAPHVTAATLRINGVDVPVRAETEPGGYTLSTRLPDQVCGLSRNGVASFELTTPVCRGQSEFRMLGLALLGMTLSADEGDLR
jgi:hypothetical protein